MDGSPLFAALFTVETKVNFAVECARRRRVRCEGRV
jgi:hypothetical protein